MAKIARPSMKRVDSTEIHEQPWFPGVLRDLVTDALQFILNLANVYLPMATRLGGALEVCGSRRVVDLCAGAGGPWPRLSPTLARLVPGGLTVTLTDKYPNASAFRRAQEASGGTIAYCAESVDAADIPAHLSGFRTIFSSFHHFAPSQASAIVQAAVDRGEGIGIFEAARRQPLTVLSATLMPLAGFLTAPFIRPFRFVRLFWTYVVPVIPFVLLYDGVLSCLRAYSLAELSALSSSLKPNDYTWEVGELRGGLAAVTYLLGYPRRATAKPAL
jgi:hypothetical protein